MVELSGVLVPPKEVVRPVLLPSALDHVPAHVALPLAVPVLLWGCFAFDFAAKSAYLDKIWSAETKVSNRGKMSTKWRKKPKKRD